jgi:hypothetical protein
MNIYTYSICKKPDGVHIDLRSPDGRNKQFFKAGDVPCEPLARHMDSLTDDHCSDWFKTRVRGKQ